MKEGSKVGKFWFSNGLPEEVKNICEPLLVKNEHLVPDWCNEVRVYWDMAGTHTGDGDLASAYIETSYAYRFASIYVCPPFLSEEDADKELRLKHELWHIVSSPLLYYVNDIVAIVSEGNESVGKIIGRECSEKVESLTEDLTNILTRIEAKQKAKK